MSRELLRMREYTFLITARGGSKGLKRKNIRLLNGLPLIVWTINAAKESFSHFEIYVSTEDSEIAQISEKHGAIVIPLPKSLALDDSSSADVVKHAINWLKKERKNITHFVLLQPTSPLRCSSHIRRAINLYEEKKPSMLVSAFQPKYSPCKAFIEQDDGLIVPIISQKLAISPRQKLPKAFQANGAIYIFSRSDFLASNGFPFQTIIPFEMTERESLDIDTLQDFELAEKILGETIVKSRN